MFAVLLSPSMDPFYQNIASFPTAIFTFILAICVLYWLSAVLGVIDIDSLDFDGLETDIALESNVSSVNALAGIMLKFGLKGIPVTIIVSFLALFSWLASYYGVHYLNPLVPAGLLTFLLNIGILIAAFWLAVLLTSLLIKLIRPLFQKIEQRTYKHILGKTANVRSSVVNEHAGEAFLHDGGAGLILKVRTYKGATFTKGDKVVLLDYLANDNIYLVISEQEFND